MGSGVNWEAVSHQDMYDKINGGAGPSSLSSSGGAWSNLSNALRTADFWVSVISNRAAADWKGAGSQSLQQAASPFSDWADVADTYAQSGNQQAVAQSEFFTSARGKIPPPDTSSMPTDNFLESAASHLPGVTTDLEAREAADRAAQKQAADAMKTYDSSTYAEVRQQYFTAPPTIAVSSMPPAASASPPGVQPPPGDGLQSPPGAVWPQGVPAAFNPAVAGQQIPGASTAPYVGSPTQPGIERPGSHTSGGVYQPVAPAAYRPPPGAGNSQRSAAYGTGGSDAGRYGPGPGGASTDPNVRAAGYAPSTSASGNATPGDGAYLGGSSGTHRTGSERQYGGAGAAAAAGVVPPMMGGTAGGGDTLAGRSGSSGSTGWRNAGGIGSGSLPGGGGSAGTGGSTSGGSAGSGAGSTGSGSTGSGSTGGGSARGGAGSGAEGAGRSAGPGEAAGARSGIGAGTGAGGGGSAAAGERMTAGGRGGPGMGGMPMGAGGRGQGGEDDEHYTPEFLKMENPFHDDRVIAPPVIGAEDQS